MNDTRHYDLFCEELVRRCKKVRTANNLSVEQMAERTGASHNTIWAIEGGHRKINLRYCYQVVQAFNITLTELFMFDGQDREKKILSDRDRKLIESLTEAMEEL